MRALFRALRKLRFSYEPLVEVRISRDALLHNFAVVKKAHPSLAIAPVLKSNAYGHGLIPIARLLEPARAPFFVIDSYAEALILRNERIRTPLLVIGYTPSVTIAQSRMADTAYTVSSLEQLEELSRILKKPCAIHLKIDTGMHRQGVMLDEVEIALGIISGNAMVHLTGVATHLADADGANAASTHAQINHWNELVRTVQRRVPSVAFFHCAATAGGAYSQMIDANVMRLGIGLYGITAGSCEYDVKPVLELRTVVSAVKCVSEGECIGYNCTFKAPHDMAIAVIPVGYAEGLDRRLSNKGTVRIHGMSCPLVGRVSMNIAAVDVSACRGVQRGDTVIVYSADRSAANTIAKSAELCGTIPHELCVRINPHLRRTITEPSALH